MNLEFHLFRRGKTGWWVLAAALVLSILASVTPRHVSTSNFLIPGGTYQSSEKLYWNWASSLYVEGIAMEIDGKNVAVSFPDHPSLGEQTFPLEGSWQDECPISEKKRQLLADLSDIEPILAIDEQRQCRYLILDDSHFLADHGGNLYLVQWHDRTVGLEVIGYIFQMVLVNPY